jgi:hypothetical protein
MQSRTNFATTALAVVWIVTGVVFGGLGFVSPAPTEQAGHPNGQVHTETGQVPSRPAHG